MNDQKTMQRNAAFTDTRLCRTVCAAYADDKLTWERVGPVCPATALVHEDDCTVNLQIELANKHALMITIRKDGRSPTTISLWHGSGEHELEQDSSAQHLLDWGLEATGGAADDNGAPGATR
jgi:hypothetical protein